MEGLRTIGLDRIRILLTDWTNGLREPAFQRVEELFAVTSDVGVERDSTREAGRGYYKDVCLKIRVARGNDEFEVGDGGTTDWTSKLLSDRKEHVCISAIGLDRLGVP